MNTQTANTFVMMLSELRKGQTVSELSEALAELVNAVKESGKKGAITIKVELVPSSGGETVLVTADWAIKEPVPNKASTTFFTTDDNLLVRHDPRQREMFGMIEGGASQVPPQDKAVNQER